MQKLDLQTYEVQLTRLLTVKEACEHFRIYLKERLTEEPLSFLLAVNAFKLEQNISEKVTAVLHIYELFIKTNADQELNIPHREREKIGKAIKNSGQETRTDDLLVSENIFDSVYTIVLRELREDSFARYIRSKLFQEFVNKKGEEFIQQFAIDISLRAYQDVILRKEDFGQRTITQKDVDFFVQTLSDSTEWQALNDKGSAYASKTRYSMVRDYKPQLFKMQGFLDCSAYQAIVAYSDPEMLKIINKGLDVLAEFKDSINEGDYPSILRHALMDSKIGKYDLYAIQTILYNPELGCYMLLSKSTTAFEDKYPLVAKPLKLMHCSAFYEISETKCRYTLISWMDMFSSPVHRLLEKMFFKLLISVRTNKTHEGLVFATNEMRKVGFVPNKFEGDRSMLDTLDEFFRRNPDKDPSIMSQMTEKEQIGE